MLVAKMQKRKRKKNAKINLKSCHQTITNQIKISERTLIFINYDYNSTPSSVPSIDRFHEDLWSIKRRRAPLANVMRTRGQRGKPWRRQPLVGSCFFFAGKTCVTDFFFIRHTPRPSPCPSVFRPLYAPFSFATRSTTTRRSFLSIFFEISPSPPSSPFLVEWREEEVLCTFVTSFEFVSSRMITITVFLFLSARLVGGGIN